MESKYYTPTIEEFHVGFEFEYLSKENNFFISNDFSLDFANDDTDTIEEVARKLGRNEIRVKLLDREDIESLGWKRYATIENYYSLNKHSMWFYSNKKIVKISVSVDYEFEETGFQGVIKNKSELRKLMIQLNIK
jgi:asparagine synthetase B (glutamine-hydrolysing)